MILRDVIVSEQARILGRGSPAETSRQERSSLAALLDPLPSVLPEMDDRSDVGPPFSVPAPLTFEQVAAWLAVQDGETRETCASLLAEELTAVHERARLSGYEAGQKRAMEEAAKEKAQVLDALSHLVSAAESAFEQERAALAEDCADVVGEVLAKIAGSTLASREAIVGTVITVLRRMKDDREATIRVHADDLPVLQLEEDKLAKLFGRSKFTLVADSRVTVGGCIVETSAGSLDGRLDVQLREMCETLRSAKAAGRESA
jgi:flagellar assembly protein FliH